MNGTVLNDKLIAGLPVIGAPYEATSVPKRMPTPKGINSNSSTAIYGTVPTKRKAKKNNSVSPESLPPQSAMVPPQAVKLLAGQADREMI